MVDKDGPGEHSPEGLPGHVVGGPLALGSTVDVNGNAILIGV